MKYSSWTRLKCVIVALVTTVLSVVVMCLGQAQIAVVCAIASGALTVYFGFAAVAAYRETADRRKELDARIAEYKAGIAANRNLKKQYQNSSSTFHRLSARAHELIDPKVDKDAPNGTDKKGSSLN